MEGDKNKIEQEKYKVLYESSRDAIMTLEPPEWRFTSANPATLKMFGVNSEREFISLGPEGFSPKKQPNNKLSSSEAKKMINKAMEKGSYFFDWIHQRVNVEKLAASGLLSKIEIAGKQMFHWSRCNGNSLRNLREFDN